MMISKDSFFRALLRMVSVMAFFLGGLVEGSLANPSPETRQAPQAPTRIVIFYSSIGMGHLSAARAIEADVKKKNPEAVVVMKNIRDFMASSTHERIDERIFWTVVKRYPDLFDRKFRESMSIGNQVQSLDHLPKYYNEQKLLNFIINENPTAVIATHYGAAVSLGNLKDQGQIKNIPVAWLHTDYFTGFFPRISQRIEKTFVAMPQMKATWEASGVIPESVTTTGMPINPSLFDPLDRVEFLKAQGLDPGIRTIVLASGGEGVGDFPLIVNKLISDVGGPLQIVAVCAKNEKHFAALTALKERVPNDIKLSVHGMIPNVDLLNYIKSADLYITKSGGLSPTEGFAITRPIILLDVYGGHERDNAALFEKEGLAVVNRRQEDIGLDAKKLFENPDLQARMLEKQLAFRNSFNLDAITEFVFNPRESLPAPVYRLGVEEGQSVKGAADAIARLQHDSPAEVEILLAYGKSRNGGFTTAGGNPFGHLAVRVGDTVYTANGRAQHGIESSQIFQTSLENYLYGVNRPLTNIELTDAYGSAYGRDNISLRVRGVPPQALEAMRQEIIQIESEWASKQIQWDAKKFNCADFVARILRAGGFDPADAIKMGAKDFNIKGKSITMPLDVFDAFRLHFENRTDIATELVGYTAVAGSENVYKTTRFPLSIHRIRSSVRYAYKKSVHDLERRIGKRLSVYNQSPVVKYENVNGQSVAEREAELARVQIEQEKSYAQLKDLEKQLDEFVRTSERENMTATNLQEEISSALKSVSENDLEAMLKGRPQDIQDETARRRIENLLVKVQRWDDLQKSFLEKKDRFIQMEFDFLIKGLRAIIADSMGRIRTGARPDQMNEMTRLFEASEKAFASYEKSLGEYGKPKDGPTRTVAIRTFFESSKAFLDRLNAYEKIRPSSSMKGFWNGIAKRSQRLYRMTYTFMKLTPAALRLALNMTFRWSTPPGEAPVMASMNRLFRSLGSELGLRVNIRNREALPIAGPLNGRKINLIVPTHRDPILDTIAMANLALDKALLVMATDQIIGRKQQADGLNRVDSIITVGRGSGQPIEKILQQLASRKSDTIIIYPEGSVSAGLGETRPLREKFSLGLIGGLEKAGYEVSLTPVTYLNTARHLHEGSIASLLHDLATPQEKVLEVKVGSPIDSRTLQVLKLAQGSEQVINRFVRSLWLENLTHDKEFLRGMLRPDQAVRTVNEKLGVSIAPGAGGAVRCEAVFASGF